MGSLMAGWSSKLLDSDRARLERNKSLTKEEIQAYWKLKRKNTNGNDTGAADGPLSPTTPKEPELMDAKKKSALWNNNNLRCNGTDDQLGSPKSDWWTRSNWAFLNEPPVEEREAAAHKYVAQFHVATVSKPRS